LKTINISAENLAILECCFLPAIDEASQISESPFTEAQWLGSDQPYLDQARCFGSGNLTSAITAAQRIHRSGRALSWGGTSGNKMGQFKPDLAKREARQ